MKRGGEATDALSESVIPTDHPDGTLYKQFHDETFKGNLRIAAGIALGVLVLASSNMAFALQLDAVAEMNSKENEFNVLTGNEVEVSVENETMQAFTQKNLNSFPLLQQEQALVLNRYGDLLSDSSELTVHSVNELKKLTSRKTETLSSPELDQDDVAQAGASLKEVQDVTQFSLNDFDDEFWDEDPVLEFYINEPFDDEFWDEDLVLEFYINEPFDDEFWDEDLVLEFYINEPFDENLNDALLFVFDPEENLGFEPDLLYEKDTDAWGGFITDIASGSEINEYEVSDEDYEIHSVLEDILHQLQNVDEVDEPIVGFVIFDKIEEHDLVDYEGEGAIPILDGPIDEDSYSSSSGVNVEDGDEVYLQQMT